MRSKEGNVSIHLLHHLVVTMKCELFSKTADSIIQTQYMLVEGMKLLQNLAMWFVGCLREMENV